MMRIVPCCAVVWLMAASPAFGADPIGEWVTGDAQGRVKIDKCGDNLWGIVSWEKTPGRDVNNPDPAKRSRPTLGLPVLLDMHPAEPNRWEGNVYNTENGKIYDARAIVTGPDKLRIEGCVLGFLCGGDNWTRYKPLPESARNSPPLAAPLDVCSVSVGSPRTPHERRLK